MLEVYYIDKEISGTCFLVKGDKKAILFDPGMAYYGEKMLEKVKILLSGRS